MTDTDIIFSRLCNGALGHRKLTADEIQRYAVSLGHPTADCAALADYDYSGD